MGLLGPLGGLLGPPWGLLGPPGGVLGRIADFLIFWLRFARLLGPSSGPLGPSWRALGPSWGPPGPSWGRLGGLLGRLGAILDASWAVLERREAEDGETPKSFKNPRKICDFGFSRASWEASWRALGPSGRPFGPSWGHLRRLGAIFRRLGAVLDRPQKPLGGPLGLSWALVGAEKVMREDAGDGGKPLGFGAKPQEILPEGVGSP